MKVTPKVFYREFRAALDAPMKAAGLELVDAALGWAKQTGEGWLGVWFQCDKWGWDPDWGSSFTTEFQLAPEPVQGCSRSRGTRIGYLLEGFPELDELRRLDNEMILRLPGTVEGKLEAIRVGDTELVTRGVRPDPEPAYYGRDLWMHYHSIEDVRAWARYFDAKLPGYLGLFERGELSAAGAASQRFHAAMGQAQSERTREGAIRILEEFARLESDPHYATAARRWFEPDEA